MRTVLLLSVFLGTDGKERDNEASLSRLPACLSFCITFIHVLTVQCMTVCLSLAQGKKRGREKLQESTSE